MVLSMGGRKTELGSRSRHVGPRFGKPEVADLGGARPFSTREKDNLQPSFSFPLLELLSSSFLLPYFFLSLASFLVSLFYSIVLESLSIFFIAP